MTDYLSATLAEILHAPDEKRRRSVLERELHRSALAERLRIHQRLHDTLCQQLLGAAFAAKAIANRLPPASAAAPEVADLARLIGDAVEQVREIVSDARLQTTR